MATDNQPQDLDQPADTTQDDLSFNFLDDVSDESLVAQISSAKTGMDIPSDLAPEPTPDAPPTPEAQNKGIGSPEKTKAEPLNFANLRKAREAAERERDQLREERDSLLQRAQEADLTKAEKAQLAQDLEAARKELSEKTEAITRVSARETPEYKQVYNLYQEGWKQLNEIVASDAIKESGVNVSAAALLQNNREAINGTIRALQESGDYASANDLQQTLSAMNVWKADLQKIEQSSVSKAQEWQKNRDGQILQSVSKAQMELAQEVPYMDFRSSAFLALPEAQQQVIKQVHEEATQGVRQVLQSANDFNQLSNLAYRNSVIVRAQALELEGLKQDLPAKEAEISRLQKELAAYQKAAGSAMPSGSNRTTIKNSGGNIDAEEEYEELMAALRSMG
jgi:regulator of replication initiation timing